MERFRGIGYSECINHFIEQGIAFAIPFDFLSDNGEETKMMEILEFILAVIFLVIAFKLTIGCLKVGLWLAGIIFLLTALASILT